MKKPSEWLSEHDSHSMYISAEMKSQFKQETGLDAPIWGEFEVNKQFIKTVEANGGYCKFPLGSKITSGYQMADATARQLIDFHSDKMGRGFLFRDCIEHLQKAGK